MTLVHPGFSGPIRPPVPAAGGSPPRWRAGERLVAGRSERAVGRATVRPAVRPVVPLVPAVGPPDVARGRARVAARTVPAETVPVRTVPAAPPPAVPATEPGPRRPAVLPALGRAPAVLLLSSLGTVLVALSYAGGRLDVRGALAAYWVGQVLVYTPVVTRLLARRLAGVGESFLLVVGLGVNQYLLKWMYSPDEFRFPDELQHWIGTTLLIERGRLFTPNPALPVSVHFPGLEEMGAAVATTTGMPVTAAGMLIAGVTHLVFVGGLFMLMRRAGGTPRVAAVTCVVYATAAHYLFFDSMYLYQSAALPFLMLAIWSSRTWRWRRPGGFGFAAVGLVSIAIVAVSHHVTAFILVGTLLLLALGELVLPRGPRNWIPVVMAGAATAAVTAWIAFPARDVLGYLRAPTHGLLDAVNNLFTGSDSSQRVISPPPDNPIWQLGLEALGLLLLLGLLAGYGAQTLHSRDRDPWRWSLLTGGVLFFGTAMLRFLGTQGPELAGRAATFAYIPMAVVAATMLVRWWSGHRKRPDRRLARLASPLVGGTLACTLLMLGARAGGWPPNWERLPGPYLVSGYERSVELEGVTAARWMLNDLGPDNRVAADVTGATLASTYGGQDPVGEGSALFTDPTWNFSDERLLDQLSIDYLWVDLRMSGQLPRSGSYFLTDPLAGQHLSPIPITSLTKFDDVAGTDRVYDSGDIHIYRMAKS